MHGAEQIFQPGSFRQMENTRLFSCQDFLIAGEEHPRQGQSSECSIHPHPDNIHAENQPGDREPYLVESDISYFHKVRYHCPLYRTESGGRGTRSCGSRDPDIAVIPYSLNKQGAPFQSRNRIVTENHREYLG